jgi:hypothetical protein
VTPSTIIAENTKRAALLRAQWDSYDPVRGTEGVIPRVSIPWDEDGPRLLPVAMLDDPHVGAALRHCWAEGENVVDYCRRKGVRVRSIEARRIVYDYEFWCAACVKIEDKSGALVQFRLKPAQRHSLTAREAQRLAGEPIRNIEHKGRQYGSTTDKGLYELWLARVVYGEGNAYLISLQQGAAAKIMRRLTIAAEKHPPWAGTVTLRGVPNAPSSREITETTSLLSIASVNNPQGPSGDTTRYALISEAGKMGSTDAQSAERLITNVMSTVPLRPGTCVMVESTAEPVGRWYRQEWEKAKNGQSGFVPTFVSWTLDPDCWAELRGFDIAEWISSWDADLAALWYEHGCVLEQVRWYAEKRREYPEPWMMKQEFPTTSAEGWQYGERRRFSPVIVTAARKTCIQPVKRGRLVSDALTGPGALSNIRWEDDPRGEVSIWRGPDDDYGGLLDTQGSRYTDGFAAAMDIGGVWEGADYTAVSVLDRRPIVFGGSPEIVAEWHGHLDSDLAAWEAARLAHWYHAALLAVEVNSLKEDQGDEADGLEPEHSLTVLDQIARVQGVNLYRRNAGFDRVTGAPRLVYGWHTNSKTKPLAVDLLNRALREGCEATATGEGGGYVERCLAACDELDTYLVLDNGAMAAAPGRKDDRVVTRAILMALHNELPPCQAVRLEDEQAARKAVAQTASNFASL